MILILIVIQLGLGDYFIFSIAVFIIPYRDRIIFIFCKKKISVPITDSGPLVIRFQNLNNLLQ